MSLKPLQIKTFITVMKKKNYVKRYSMKITIPTNKLMVVFLLTALGISRISAQQTVTSTGGASTGPGGSLSFTVGQIICKTHSSSAGSLSEGVQQPVEISVVTDVSNDFVIGLESVVFPNPTIGKLTIRIDVNEVNGLFYRLMDNKGRLIKVGRINEIETSIDMGSLPPAVYYLNVSKENMSLKVFKIVKKHN